MTEQATETRQHSAKEIVQEALDTIKATYWIQGMEFTFVALDWGWEGDQRVCDTAKWDEVEKAKVVSSSSVLDISQTYIEPTSGKAKVSGVCSIGALALANSTLYGDPLKPWSTVAEYDLETFKAGAALAMVILEGDPERFNNEDAGSVIASWNDNDHMTREVIIDAFTKALDHPLLEAEQIYCLQREGAGYWPDVRVWFPSEEAADAFIAGESPLRKILDEEWGRDSSFRARHVDYSDREATDEEDGE